MKDKPKTHLNKKLTSHLSFDVPLSIHHQRNQCKFPKLLNKKWQNIQRTKSAFNLNSHQMQIFYLNNENNFILSQNVSSHTSPKTKQTQNQNEFNSNNFLKLNCIHSLSLTQILKNQKKSKFKPKQKHHQNNSVNDDANNSKRKQEFLFVVNNLNEWYSTLSY